MALLKRIKRLSFFRHTISGLLLFFAPLYVSAGNGLNVIGFGHESIQMGGADIAVARDTSALSTNPAGLTQIKGNAIDLNVVVIDIGPVTHSDQLGNNSHPDNNPMYGMSAGFAQELSNSPISWGVGVFGQGGAGVEYGQLNTPFSTTDELSSQLLTIKASAGIAYKVNKDLSLGISLSLLHSELDQKIFPDTSIAFAGGGFFGQEIKDATADSFSARLGVMHQITSNVILGVAYSTSSSLDYSGDKFVMNFTSIGLGKVTYNSVKIEGRRQPQEFGVGAFIKSTENLHIALEANWIDWSSAMKKATLTATKPDNNLAPSTVQVNLLDNWRDQVVLAIGFVYQLNENMVFRGGFNYGRNPVPDETLNPLLATITEKHLTLGLGHRVSKSWEVNAGLQLDLKNEATSTNPQSLTGPGSTERISSQSLILTTSHYW